MKLGWLASFVVPRLAVALCVGGLVPFALSAADLDAPLAKEPVTIRTEIERGFAATPDPLWIPIRNYPEAVESVSKANIKKHTDSKAFTFGLYYAAWHRLWSGLRSGHYKSDQERQAISNAEYFYLIAQLYQKHLDLSDADVRKACSLLYIEDEATIFTQAVKTGWFRAPKPKRSPSP